MSGMELGGGGKGGKRSLNADLNLVPFIDLMAVTIVFLIMTAVWTQLGRLQVGNAGQSVMEDQTQDLPKGLPITLLVTDHELKLTVGGSQLDPLPVVMDARGRLDVVKLVERLQELKAQQPDQAAITIQPEDTVRFDVLVRLIDTCLGHQFPAVSVAPASPG